MRDHSIMGRADFRPSATQIAELVERGVDVTLIDKMDRREASNLINLFRLGGRRHKGIR